MRKLVTSRVFLSIVAATVAIGATVGIGVALRGSSDATASSDAESATTTTSTAPPTTTTTVFVPPALVQPPFAELPDVGPGIGPGDSGPVVQAYEQRLADTRFDPGEIDGTYDEATRYAVEALQKSLDGEITGRIGPDTAFVMQFYQFNQPLEPYGGANRTEIDIAKQIITVYSDWQVGLITTTSTGGGHTYCYNTPRVNPTTRICEDANTPSGRYEFYEFRSGWDPSPLGRLYNPIYFHGGIAVHGYESVPTEPASSGCARIPMHIAEYFHEMVSIGDPVYVFGGTDAVIHSRTPIRATPPLPPPPPPPPEPEPAPAYPEPAPLPPPESAPPPDG